MAALSVTAANVAASAAARVDRGRKAAAAVTAGQVVYLNADGKWALADADGGALTAGDNSDIGIAINGAAANQELSVVLEDPAFTPGATVAINTIYILGATAGAINPAGDLTEAWRLVILAVGISTSQVALRVTKSKIATPGA